MSELAFASQALRGLAPPSGSVKQRIAAAARRLRLSASRAKDIWYADPRVRLTIPELRAIEEAAGRRHAHEIAETDRLIERARAILERGDTDLHRLLAAVLVAADGRGDRA